MAGNHPWPGDPMQSFKVLLHHRAACRPGGVLVGLFWTDPDEIDRSFPISALRSDRRDGGLGRLGDPTALADRPATFGGRLAGRVHDPLGSRAGRRPHGAGLRPAAS